MTANPRIFWDGYGLSLPHSGVYVHASHLAAELVRAGTKPTLITESRHRELLPEVDHLVLKSLPIFAGLGRSKPLWPLRVGRLAEVAARGEKHIVHGLSNFNIPFGTRIQGQSRVVTVHDLIPLLDPSSVAPTYALQMKLLFGRVCDVADRIICVSEWTRRSLLERFPRHESKCVTIPNGAPSNPDFSGRGRRSGPDVNLLTVARFESYKRLDYVVQILRQLPIHYVATLLTDRRGEEWMETNARDLLAVKRLVVRTNVSATVLAALYANADVLLHPSRYEGFCLPVVEALASGCAVVYQSGSAIDEIVAEEVGIGVPEGGTLDHWVQATEQAFSLTQADEWIAQIQAHYLSLPTWKDSAIRIQTLYNDLTS